MASVLATAVVIATLLVANRDPGDARSGEILGRVVSTQAGNVRGSVADGVESWKGIPFAAPPVGPLRWKAPEPAESWSGVRKTTTYADQCVQPEGATVPEGAGMSEDCLYLSVHRPDTTTKDLPVMVWLHGGSFTQGSGGEPGYNKGGLFRRDVVVVTVNYRLGRLGFFAHPALDEPAANFGLLDQLAALQWVRDNIANFGGDADRVTLFGQSAGAISVNALMASPLAQGLFGRAIAMSALNPVATVSRAEAAAADTKLAEGLQASTDEELRALPAEDIAAWPLNVLAGEAPIVDGAVLPQPIADVFAAGNELAVPYLTGTMDLEFPNRLFRGLTPDPDEQRREAAGTREPQLIEAYGSQQAYRQHFISDVLFTEPTRDLAMAHAEIAPSYLYRFSIASAETQRYYGGAKHSAELGYVFDSVTDASAKLANAEELADAMAGAWVRFATTGDPSPLAIPWPEADAGGVIAFGNSGVAPLPVDPWKQRLDAVRALAPAARS